VVAEVAATAHTPHVAEGEGAIVEESDRTATITALHRDPAIAVVLTDTHPSGAVAVAVGQHICLSTVAHRRSYRGLRFPVMVIGLFPHRLI